jgi:hypothetical protein
MMPVRWEDFSAIWSIDFEYATTCGTGRPIPHTFVAHDLISDREILLAGDRLRKAKRAPIDVRRCACLAYNFVGEAQCFEVLGWNQPHWPVDPYAEHLALTNGLTSQDVFEREEDDRRIGYRLVDALRFYGIEVTAEGETHKHEMQLRSAQGEPFTVSEWQAITKYCVEDVQWLVRLFAVLREKIDLPAALVRGRYMTVIGQQMHRGIPVDRALVERFKAQRPSPKPSVM